MRGRLATAAGSAGSKAPPRRPRRGPPPARGGIFDDPITVRQPRSPDPSLTNEDLLPTPLDKRTFRASDFAALWVTLVISLTTYYLAASLVDLGMSWVQGVATVFAGNLVTLVPMVLNAHPGTRWGVPFPVLARASFGVRGAHLPSLSRALVACGWYGIQTWVGGSSIHTILQALSGGALPADPLPLLGISAAQLGCFMAFWLLQAAIILRGIECIKEVERASAPILVVLALALLWWAVGTAGGFGPMLSAPGMPLDGRFWRVCLPALTANVGYWATLCLNIADFSRYAVSQRAQLLGQAVGLPPFMALFSFIGLAVTSATVVIYGAPVVDPVNLLSKMQQPLAVCASLFGLILATLTTNLAANVVAPANALISLFPSLPFAAGGLAAAALALASAPWRLLGSSGSFVGWLVACSALLGPVAGCVLADYYLIRERVLDIDGLYSMAPDGPYFYWGGWNPAALLAVAAGVAPCAPGLLAAAGVAGPPPALFALAYDCAWFVGAAVAASVYWFAMRRLQAEGGADGEEAGGGGPVSAPAAGS